MLCNECAIRKAGLSSYAIKSLLFYLAARNRHQPHCRPFSNHPYHRNNSEHESRNATESNSRTTAEAWRKSNDRKGSNKKHKIVRADTRKSQVDNARQIAWKEDSQKPRGDLIINTLNKQQQIPTTQTSKLSTSDGLERVNGASTASGGKLTGNANFSLSNRPDALKTLTKHETRALSALVQKLTRNLAPQTSTTTQSREEAVQEVYRKMPILKNFPDIAYEAFRSIGVNTTETQESRFDDEDGMIEEQNKQESRRIQQKILDAHTDDEIWAILKEEFFDKVKDLERDLDVPLLTVQASKVEHQKEVAELHDSSLAERQKQRQAIRVFAKLYPNMLIFALRRLRTAFEWSPRISSILPAIKALGITSYVMGASNMLYNELIRHRWQVFNDTKGVLTLLTEMEVAGLATTSTTADILHDIVSHQEKARRGDLGPCLMSLESMTEKQHQGEKISKWKNKILRELQQARFEAAKRKQLEKQLIRDEILAINEQD